MYRAVKFVILVLLLVNLRVPAEAQPSQQVSLAVPAILENSTAIQTAIASLAGIDVTIVPIETSPLQPMPMHLGTI